MVKRFALSLLLLAGCHRRELNLDAVDLSSYSKDLNSAQSEFPVYIGRVQALNQDVSALQSLLNQSAKPRQVYLLAPKGKLSEACTYALVLQDPSKPVVEILISKFEDDAKRFEWTEPEQRQLFDRILQQNQAYGIRYYFRAHPKPALLSSLEPYSAILEASAADYHTSSLSGKAHLRLSRLGFAEFADYVQAMDGSPEVAFGIFGFLQGHDLLSAATSVLDRIREEPEQPAADLIFSYYQAVQSKALANEDIRLNIEGLITSFHKLSPKRIEQIDARLAKDPSYYIDLPRSKSHKKILESLERIHQDVEATSELRELIMTAAEQARSNPIVLDSQYCEPPHSYPLKSGRYLIQCQDSEANLCLDTGGMFANVSNLWSTQSFPISSSVTCNVLKHEPLDLLRMIGDFEFKAGRSFPKLVNNNLCNGSAASGQILANCQFEDQQVCLEVGEHFYGKKNISRFKKIEINQINCKIISN